ncbi:MAG: hypothetical protein JJE28_09945 [Actinomycetales bacterium]|nr:hypothetical protein [Actinomycetales bacterium]
MPKNDKKKTGENASVKGAKATIPTAAYTPPVESVDAVSPTPISSRRLGTGAIIGVSVAAVALLAGVFGGGVALGATAANHGPDGISHEMKEASGRMLGGVGQEAGMQGSPRQGSGMNGPMNGKGARDGDAKRMNVVPGDAPQHGTSTSAPIPTN